MSRPGAGRWAPALAAALALILFGGAAALLLNRGVREDPNAKPAITGMPRTEAEWREYLQTAADESQLRFKLNQRIPVDGAGVASLLLENALENRVHIRLTLNLEDGRTVYQSPVLAPGRMVQEAALAQPLAPGEWPGTALVQALDPDTGEVVGQAEVSVLLMAEAGTE